MAIATFACVAWTAALFNGIVLDTILGWVVIVTATSLLVGLAWSRLKTKFGLLGRLFYCSMIGWFLVIGIELIRLAL